MNLFRKKKKNLHELDQKIIDIDFLRSLYRRYRSDRGKERWGRREGPEGSVVVENGPIDIFGEVVRQVEEIKGVG